ncbi:MAG: hemolysin family protein, partial [Candidatus Thiodiazotropha sp. (ex Ctena orbiculata)]|nr:hemolysin family protein [Candidatus Thiodiazotropha taylori]
MEVAFSLLNEYWESISGFFYFDPSLLDNPDLTWRLVLQLFLLMGSAFFSGSETALFSLSRLDLRQLRQNRHRHSPTLHALLDQPRRLIISILCGNELINIAAVANMTGILVMLYGPDRAGLISVLVMVPLLLLLGEITPKTIAVSNPVGVSSRVVAGPMSIWVRFIFPLRWLIRGIADRVTGWIVGSEKAPENILQLDEFRYLVDEIANEGELHDTERTLIYHLLDAGSTEIVEIMTPRTQVAFIDKSGSITEVIEQFRTFRHSRVPVYQGHRDNVIGFLHIEDVMPIVMDEVDPETLNIESLLRMPIVVPPTKKVDEMFEFFQKNNARAAVVLDEFGGVEGFVTMRDVLTFIFGHLSGEIHGEALYEERDQNVYEVPGEMKLTDFDDLTNFGIEDPRMTTIAGVAFRHLDRLPKVGDKVMVEGIEITVLQVQEQRIVRVRVARGQ